MTQAEEISSRSADGDSSVQKFFPTARQLFLILAIYFAAHIVIRSLLSNSVDMDEGDQMVLTQKLSWGYGPQPPLYSWVQIGFFQIFGVGIFALALWKFILLFTTHVLTYFNVRFITRSHACAVAGVASLFLFHQFAYESVRDLTHSVIATTIAAATLYVLMRLQQKKTIGGYILLGLCIGLGFLGKYNFVVVAGSLVAAALTLPGYRRTILDWRFAIGLLVATILVLPNVLWMLDHRDIVMVTAYKFETNHWTRAVAIWHGLKNMGLATLTFSGPFLVIFGVLLWRQPKRPLRLHTPHEKLILRSLLFTGMGFVLAVIFLHTAGFRDRWFQPIFISVPVLVIAICRDRVDARFVHRLCGVAAVVMLLVLITIPVRVLYSEKFILTHLNNPYDDFAAQMRPALEGINTIVCDERQMAGNLRLSIPDKIFVTPELVTVLATDTNRYALVWEAIRSDEPPRNVLAFAESFGMTNIETLSPQIIGAKYKHYRTKTMHIGYAILDPAMIKQKTTTAAP